MKYVLVSIQIGSFFYLFVLVFLLLPVMPFTILKQEVDYHFATVRAIYPIVVNLTTTYRLRAITRRSWVLRNRSHESVYSSRRQLGWKNGVRYRALFGILFLKRMIRGKTCTFSVFAGHLAVALYLYERETTEYPRARELCFNR
jgi:hypothetical protein